MNKGRLQRLQIMLDNNELAALETWRFTKHMPSRAAAVRELLRRGLVAEGFEVAKVGSHSESFGVIKTPEPKKDN
jgi:hypothetical protein